MKSSQSPKIQFVNLAYVEFSMKTLFLGWGAMAVGIAGGILGVCASWSAMNEDDGADDYNMGYDKGPAYDAGRPNGYV